MTNELIGRVLEVGWTGWPHGVTDAVLEVAEALRCCCPGDSLTVTVPEPPNASEHRGALREGLRGIIHSSIRERDDVRVNLALGGSSGDRDRTVGYLDSATFVYGATVDLGVSS